MYKILIADDEKMARERLCQYVNKIPDTQIVASFKNGFQAIEYLKSNAVNLVISDIRMPLADGLELAEWVSKNVPDCALILVSAYNEFDYAQKAIDFGVKSYLLKPLTFESVEESILKLKKMWMDKEKAALYKRDLQQEKTEASLKKWIQKKQTDFPENIKDRTCIVLAFKLYYQNQEEREMLLVGIRNILGFTTSKENAFHLGKREQKEFFAIFHSKEEKYSDVQEIKRIVKELLEKGAEIENTCVFDRLEDLQIFWNEEDIQEDEVIARVKEYIVNHLKDSISRDAVATSLYMDCTYFSKYFKKKTGLSFQDYVKEVRIEKAKEFLKKGWRVKDVCEAVGYQDRNYFNKLFRQATGFSPMDYKRNLEFEQMENVEL